MGGTLLDKIIKLKSFSERKASKYLKSVLSAVCYMHDLDIVHRDIKCQNLLFDVAGKDGVLQVIDFGESKQIDEGQTYYESVGTPHYMPPEIARARTGEELKASDLWSVGVVTYILVCGGPPFRGESTEEILTKIVASRHKTDSLFPKRLRLTASCKDFIGRLLCHDISSRLSAKDALRHEWIAGSAASNKELDVDHLQSLKRYRHQNKLKDILVNAVLEEMELEDQQVLSEGLQQLNRQTSNMNEDVVVDYLLLHSRIDELPLHNKKWQKRRIREVQKFSQTKPTIHEIEEDTSNMSDLFGGLTSADVDDVLRSAEQIESEYTDSDDDDESLHTDSDDNDEPIREIPLLRKSTASVNDMKAGRISVDRFRSIVSKSPKQYDFSPIVRDLDDGTGHISLFSIGQYTKNPETLHERPLDLDFELSM